MIIGLKFNRLATHHGVEGAYFSPVRRNQGGTRQFLSTALMAYMLAPEVMIEAAERRVAMLDDYDIPLPELQKAYGARIGTSIDRIDQRLDKQKRPLFFSHVMNGETEQLARFEAPKGSFAMVLKAGDVRCLLENKNLRLKNGLFIPESQLIRSLDFLKTEASSPARQPGLTRF